MHIDQVQSGAFVRLVLHTASASRLRSFLPRHRGVFRAQYGGEKTPLDAKEWKRIGGINKRAFTARVLSNDSVARELRLSIEDPGSTKSIQMHYELILPYSEMMRIAVLVPQARTLSPTEEEKFRRKHRSSPVHKQFFHPFDRFEAVTLV